MHGYDMKEQTWFTVKFNMKRKKKKDIYSTKINDTERFFLFFEKKKKDMWYKVLESSIVQVYLTNMKGLDANKSWKISWSVQI